MTADEVINLLCGIKTGEKPITEKPDELTGISFSGKDLSDLDLSSITLKNCDFSHANLTRAQFFNTKITASFFQESDLSFANFTGCELKEVNLNFAKAKQAGFGMAQFDKCSAFQSDFESSTFSKAIMTHSDFRCAILKKARIREARLIYVDFTEAVLSEVDMSLAYVKGSIFNNADLRGARLRCIQGYEKAQWIGTDIREINFAGAYMMRRFITDQNYLKEFRTQNRFYNVLYYIWKVTSDCGRSMVLWCFWIVILILVFSWLYSIVDIDWGPYPTKLSPLYYSVVTFTTLGYGEVRPGSLGGQVVAMAEVIIGYMMLGGLLSILSNKMARRAD